jgi:hypothetical protein
MFPFAYPGNAHSHHGCVGHMVSTTLRTWWAAWPNYISTTASLSLCLSLCVLAIGSTKTEWLTIRQVRDLSAEQVRQDLPRHRDTGSFVPQRDAWQDQRRLSLRTGGWRPRFAQRLSSEAWIYSDGMPKMYCFLFLFRVSFRCWDSLF